MADENSILKLMIQLGVIGLDDAKAVKQLMDETGKSAEELGKQMGVVNVSQADVNKILGQSGEKAELSHMGMRRLANTMGSEIPGAAALMEAGFASATEPMMGATFLLIGGIEMLRNAVAKLNAEEEESKKLTEQLSDIDGEHSKVIEKQREALDGARVSQAEYLHEFIRNTEDAIAKSTALAQAIVKAQSATGESRDNTRKGIAEKEVEEMEQRGVISHATALKMKEQLDIQYEQQKLARTMAQDLVEEQLIANELADKKGQSKKLAGDETGAASRVESAAMAKAANDTKIEEAQGKIDKATEFKKSLRGTGVDEETVSKLQEIFQKFTSSDAGKKLFQEKMGGSADQASLSEMFTFVQQKMGLGGRTGEYAFEMLPKIIQDSLGASGKNLQALAGLGPEGDKNLALYEGANFDIKAGKSDLAAAKNKRPYLELAEGNAQSDLEAARRAQEKNRDDVRTLQDKLKETAATNEIKEGGARSDLGMHKANNELEADRGIADNLLAGKGATSADQKRLIDAASLIAGHQVNLGTAAQIIENGAHNVGIFMNQVDRLATVFQKLNPAQRTDLDAKIDALQRQVAAIAEIGHR